MQEFLPSPSITLQWVMHTTKSPCCCLTGPDPEEKIWTRELTCRHGRDRLKTPLFNVETSMVQ